MGVTIYHNPRCSKSRQTLEKIRQAGIEPTVIEYLKTPPSGDDIKSLLAKLGKENPRDIMRVKEAPFAELDLGNPAQDNEKLITAIAENPILLERPIVISDKGAQICRPPELVASLL